MPRAISRTGKASKSGKESAGGELERLKLELARWERFFRSLLENSNEFILIIDPEGTMCYVSSSVKNLLDYDSGEVTGRKVFEFFHPEDIPRAGALIAELAGQPGASGVAEFRVRHRDGRWLHIEGTATNRLDDPDIRGIVINNHDITSRLEAEKELRRWSDELDKRVRERTSQLRSALAELRAESAQRRKAVEAFEESEVKFKRLAEHTNDVVYSIDAEGWFTYMSPQIRRYGYEPEEFFGKTFMDVIHEQDVEKILADFRRTAETGEEFPTQFRIRDKQGNLYWVEEFGRVMRDEADHFIGITGALRDITARKEAELELQRHREHLEEMVRERTAEITKANRQLEKEIRQRCKTENALRRSEERYRYVVETMREGLCLVDENMKLLFVNDALCTMTGFSRKALTGASPAVFIDEKNMKIVRQEFEKRKTGHYRNYEVELKRRDGNRVQVFVSPRPVNDEEGNFKGSVAVVTDITERRRVEEALRKSEERYRSIFNSASVAILEEDYSGLKSMVERLRQQGITDIKQYALDNPGFIDQAISSIRIVDVNQTAVRLFGARSRKQLLCTLDRIVTEETYNVFREAILGILTGAEELEFETVNRTLTGEKLDVLVRISFLEHSRGDFTCLVTIIDITELKRAQATARESGERYRLLIENAGNPIYLVDADGVVLMTNNLAAQYLHKKPIEIVGRSIREFIPAELAKRHLRDLRRAIRRGREQNLEYETDFGGRNLCLKVNIQPYGEVDGTAAALVIAHDITELKKVQAQLCKERDLLEQRVTESTAALRKSEMRQQERLRELTCIYSIREAFDRNQTLEETLTSCLLIIRQALHDPGRKNVVINLDGQQREAENWAPGRDDYLEHLFQIGGLKRGFLRVYSYGRKEDFLPFEVDLVKHAGASLADFIQNRELRSQLIQSEKMAAAGRLAAGVAHEINNPLGAIKNSLYILRRHVPADHSDASFITLMDSEIDRVAGIISQLYNLYRPSASKNQEVDMTVAVDNVLKMLESQARRRKIDVMNEMPVPGPKPRLPVNPVTQILYNVILNSIQAMPYGGRLTIGCTRSREKIELWVSDTGHGIPDDVMPHIFEPFFTTKTKGANPLEGMGIGLSLSRSFIEAMGGTIAVKSRVGWGTTFILAFPAKTSDHTGRTSQDGKIPSRPGRTERPADE